MNQDKVLQRKQNILQAATRLITHYGFDKTTMDDIAREAGVSKGALYLIWPSKEALVEELIVFEMKRYVLDFQQRMEQDPQGGTVASLYTHGLLALNDNPLVKALYTQDNRVLGDYVKRQDTSRYTRRVMLAEDAVREMQAANLLRQDIRPEIITYLFSIISVGFIYVGTILPPADQPPLDEVICVLGDVLQRGLGRPGEGAGGKLADGQLAGSKLTDGQLAGSKLTDSQLAASKLAISKLDEQVLQQYNAAEAKHED